MSKAFFSSASSLRLATWLSLTAVIFLASAAVFAQSPPPVDMAKTQELFNAANALMSKGDAKQAADKYSEAISAAPTIPSIYVNRGMAYAALSKFPEALADAEKALSLFENGEYPPNHVAAAYLVKAMVFQNQGKHDQAIELCSKGIELDPTNAKLFNNRGNVYRQMGKYAEALRDYDKAIELDPTMAALYVNRGGIHLRLKNTGSIAS